MILLSRAQHPADSFDGGLTQWFSTGVILTPPEDTWRYMQTFLVVTMGRGNTTSI